jgi:regulator of protease activity HflC (stomatin/prohibitin superfamily)
VGGIRPASTEATPEGETLPPQAAPYLTGDGNVVLLDATLTYHIVDPAAYVLEEQHVTPALDRLFQASAVSVTAKWGLNDFLVAQPNSKGSSTGSVGLRAEVRDGLLKALNDRLAKLNATGMGLGIQIDRIDMTAWLPPEAKLAFDAVLTATQKANQNIATARTDAERLRQGAQRESDRLVSEAQATAKERTVAATVDTAKIIALESEETPQTRDSLLMQAYRDGTAHILNTVGTVTLIDPRSGARFILPGGQKK